MEKSAGEFYLAGNYSCMPVLNEGVQTAGSVSRTKPTSAALPPARVLG